MVESWRSILSGSFGDLVRPETELWNRVEARFSTRMAFRWRG